MCSSDKKIKNRKVKSLLKDYSTAIDDALIGIAITNKGLVVLENYRIVMRRDHKTMKGKVKILAGGGAGLEPADACYVGAGMLTAVAIGDIFTAPSVNTILVAIRELAFEHPDGILLLVKNYVGDRLNFGLAMERAMSEGVPVKMLLIGDDAANWKPNNQGRRGLAGSILVYKIAGGMAEAGKSLEDIFTACREFCLTDLSTVSVTLAACSFSKWEPLDYYIKDDEMVLGLGTYGQHGVKEVKLSNINETVRIVLDMLSNPASRAHIQFDQSPVAVLINNLGSTTKLEECVVAMETAKQLTSRGVKIIRQYSGTFMPSLDSQGFSITILKITCQETSKYLDAPTSAPGWPRTCCGKCADSNLSPNADLEYIIKPNCQHRKLDAKRFEGISHGPALSENAALALDQIACFAVEAVMSCEKELDAMDFETGDGDTGSMLKKGASALKTALREGSISAKYPFVFFQNVGDIMGQHIAGITGALYSVFFTSASKIFQTASEVDPNVWCQAFKAGVSAMKRYGKVELGERSVIDALCPACEAFESALANKEHVSQAVYVAAAVCERNADKTKNMIPCYGRTSRQKKAMIHPDPGAYAAAVWMKAISEGVKLKYPPR